MLLSTKAIRHSLLFTGRLLARARGSGHTSAGHTLISSVGAGQDPTPGQGRDGSLCEHKPDLLLLSSKFLIFVQHTALLGDEHVVPDVIRGKFLVREMGIH